LNIYFDFNLRKLASDVKLQKSETKVLKRTTVHAKTYLTLCHFTAIPVYLWSVLDRNERYTL
jgi:hypothetical protein